MQKNLAYNSLNFQFNEMNIFKLGFTPYKAEKATTRHGVIRKGNTKGLKHTVHLFRKRDVC